MKLSIRQLAVGRCPECGQYPDWFNDVPMKAFCWGGDKRPHAERSRIVTGKAQPYGYISRSFWKDEYGKKVGKSISQQIISSYPNGVCPDCNWKIRCDVKECDGCRNCGHVFYLPVK